MSVTNGYKYGGIYCVIPIGKLYDERIAESVRWRLKKYLGISAKELEKQNLNTVIRETIDKRVKEEMSTQKYATYRTLNVHVPRLRVGMSSDAKRRVEEQEEKRAIFKELQQEVTNSYGFAIYHNGVLQSYSPAPFSGKQRGEDRLRSFFEENKNKFPSVGSRGANNINNWQIVIAVAHYVAARFEATGAYPDNLYKGFGKMVLLDFAQVIANAVRKSFGRTSQPVQYGYILSRKGFEGQVFRSNAVAST